MITSFYQSLPTKLCAAGHVNNVTYNRYAESARVNWTLNFATAIDPTHGKEWSQLGTNKGTGMILRSIKTDFKFPMTYPDHITVLHKLATPPSFSTDHFILDVVIFSEKHQRPAARLVEDIVVYDYIKGKKAPLKPFMVEGFQQIWREQEAVKLEVGRKVISIEERIRDLEQASWDRADAVEDLGSAT
jgi:acyl-CoA thioesterase FadM